MGAHSTCDSERARGCSSCIRKGVRRGKVTACFRFTFAQATAEGFFSEVFPKRRRFFAHAGTCPRALTHSWGACQTERIPERANTRSLNGGMNAGKFS